MIFGNEAMRGGVFSIIGTCCLLVGCSTSPIVVDKTVDPTAANLLKIGSAYNRFCAQNKRPPVAAKDIQGLLPPAEAEAILRSPRDGEPVVVCWGVDVTKGAPWATSTPVLAYEKKGADGARYVLTTMGNVELMPEQDFRSASFPPGHKPEF